MKNNIVYEHNNLITAKYSLSLNEKRILLCAISKINPKGGCTTDLSVKITIHEIQELFNIKGKAYDYYKRVCRGLRGKEFPIKRLSEDDNDEVFVGWINKATTNKNDGTIKISFDKDIIPYLIELKQYTKYKLECISKFKSFHSIRVYELLKRYENLKEKIIDVFELKKILCIDDKYKEFKNFRRFVLDLVVEEINKYSDINTKYFMIKKGRKVEKIKFIIESQNIINKEIETNTEKQNNKKSSYIEELKKIIQEDLSDDGLEAILSVAENDMEKIKEKYAIAKVSNYDNLAGFMIKAIVNDYKMPIKNKKPTTTNRFHNFEQRTSKYTKEELETILKSKKA